MQRKYDLIVAKPFHCVAAVLETILRFEGRRDWPQERIGQALGIVVPAAYAARYPNCHVSEQVRLWGTCVRDSLNPFLREVGTNLTEEYIPISHLQDWEFDDRLRAAIGGDCHVVCGFSYAVLFRRNRVSTDQGHVALVVARAAPEGVRLLDPGPDDAGEKDVRTDDLYAAVRARGDGLWIISRGEHRT